MEDKMGDILTVEDMAQMLKVKPNTIHNKKWQKKTACPLVKRGKRLLSERNTFLVWFRRGLLA